MDRKERITNRYLYMLLPAGLASVGWAVVVFDWRQIHIGFAAFAFATIFFSSYLRVQLPRTKIHLTISDALIFLSLLMYGGAAAILLAICETAFASLNLRRHGVPMKRQTVLINILITAISVAFTTVAVAIMFGPAQSAVESVSSIGFFWLLAVIAISQFCVNSICVSAFVALKTEQKLWKVWNEYCLNALVMYISGAAMAGIATKAVQQINISMFAAVIVLFALVYTTYKRYTTDVKETAAKAEDAERQRAEQAEAHVQELRHYVGELERSSAALRDSREMFRHAAYHDALTELPNRNQFIESLTELLEAGTKDRDLKFAILFFDLNRFKTINDSLGHSLGDELIRQVGARLSELTSEADLVGRFSGDEFAILLKNVDSIEAVTLFAETAAEQIEEPFLLNGRYVFANVSIGIAFNNERYTKPEEILRDADIAMYYAKERKQNYVIFDEKMHARAVTLLELETDLRYAIAKEKLELFYQPIINLKQMTLAGFEALVRWNHPTRGLVAPDEFIALSEDTGLIVPMTVQLLYKACRQLVQWRANSPDNELLTMSVNISGKHFEDGDLVSQLKTVIAETRINPAHLKLEITESAVMENAEQAIATLHEIKRTGVRISIDDFGTGYSSLSYLHRFPIDALKIDRSFVGTMEDASENGEIVRTVIALAAALNLNVIAEGIESIHQMHQLSILGCEYGQGYLFSRPQPAKEIDRLLQDKMRWQSILSGPDLPMVRPETDHTYLELTQ